MTLVNNHLGYNKLISFQKGGLVPPKNEKIQKLLPYLAYKLTVQDDPQFEELYKQIKIDPSKYKGKSMEEWTSTIQNNKEDLDQITKLAAQLPEEFWDSLEQHYAQVEQGAQEQQMQYAKKGAALKKLKEKSAVKQANQNVTDAISNPVLTQAKSGAKIKKRKCSCGCDMVLTKAKGGKLTETCSCNCKGGKMKKK